MSKNYNVFALQGKELTDAEFISDLKEEQGIEVPMDLANTPRLNDFVINEVYRQNVNDIQKMKDPVSDEYYTPKQAQEIAAQYRTSAMNNVKKLMRIK